MARQTPAAALHRSARGLRCQRGARRYKALPPITKYYFLAAVATTILVTVGLTEPLQLYMDYTLVRYFQVCAADRAQAQRAELQRRAALGAVCWGKTRHVTERACGRAARAQVWRLLTCFIFFGGFGINFLINVFLL
jgi:hypothetical protein